jgi:hypothetical protein
VTPGNRRRYALWRERDATPPWAVLGPDLGATSIELGASLEAHGDAEVCEWPATSESFPPR